MSDWRAYNNEWLAKLSGTALGLPGLQADACFAGVGVAQATTNRPFICRGQVLDAIAYTHCYRVALDNQGGVWRCITSLQSSALAFGSKEVTTLAPGNCVWVIRHPGLTYGVIFAVEPPFATSASLCRNDQIHQSSRCGIQVDAAHYKLFEGAGGILDASAGRPLDSLPVGETGWQAETGLRIWQDSFMSQLGADEACGVFAFYLDQFLRIAGLNLQEFSAQHVRQLLDDVGESFAVEGYAVYPWEQYGAFKPSLEVLRTLSPNECQTSQSHYSAKEPKTDDQTPYHRLRYFRGYLGQGGKRLLTIPPDSSQLNKLSNTSETADQGVFEEQLALHGGYSIRSARGIVITKRPAIAAPRQTKLPEDPTGDTASDYKASGQFGSGTSHQVAGQFTRSGGAPAAPQTAASALDLMAFMFEWDGSHPFRYHAKDWTTQTEPETKVASNQQSIPFDRLQSQFYLDPPTPVQMRVDHRYGMVDYYPNTSFLGLWDDGSVTQADGFGSSVSMAGGHIMVDAPGDIWLKAGRNVNIWAGQDIVLRARNSIDVSTTEKDIRIKAEKNLHMIGGAGGETGGVLVEAPTPSVYQFLGKEGEEVVSGGIILKAKQGALAGLGRDIYLRTGGGDIQSGGVMLLDANKGQGDAYVYANTFRKFLTAADVTYFGQEGQVQKTITATPVGLAVDGILEFDGLLRGKGQLLLNGPLALINGAIYFDKNPAESLFSMKPEAVKKLADSFETLTTNFTTNRTNGATTYKALKSRFYEKEKIGHPETIQSIKFTFRNQQQYKTTDASIFESYWQQLAREGGGGGVPWIEKQCNKTWPYPGEQAYQSTGFRQQILALYDVSTGSSKAAGASGGIYTTPTLQSTSPTGLNGGYMVNSQ